MRYWTWDDVFMWAGVAGAVLGLLAVAVALGVIAQTETRCYAAGYPGTRVTWNLERYCVKRVDQTDVVVKAP